MGLFNKYPYTDFHEINLDWVIRQVKQLELTLTNFINLNTIKYANPITWNITTQYEANTVVVDPQTGDAYISVKAVPNGVSISNSDYWTKIFNYADSINKLQAQIAIADEKSSTTASAPRFTGDLVWLNGELYRVTSNMIAGDTYVIGSNCVKTTIENELKNIEAEIDNIKLVSMYKTVSDMASDPKLFEGITQCAGYNTANDNGGAYYIINNDNTGDFVIECQNNLYAHIVINKSMNIACFGVDETGTTDIANVLTKALTYCDEIIFNADKTYKIDSPIELNNKTLMGNIESMNRVPIINTSSGFIVRYKGTTIKNFHIISSEQQGNCITLSGVAGVTNSCAENTFENLYIDNFDVAILFNGVVWNNKFTSIRANFNNYAVYKSDDFTCFGNTFTNFYTSGSKIGNVVANRFSAVFISGIFGFSVLNSFVFTLGCNVTFINSNFECDKHISELATGGFAEMIQLSSGRFSFINCYFTPNLESNMRIFRIGAGVDEVKLEGCVYLTVSGNLSEEPFSFPVQPLHYRSVILDEGCSSFPVQIEGAHRFSYGVYPNIIYKFISPIMRYYSASYIETSKLHAGEIQYDISRNKVTLFNGTTFVDL